MAVSLRSDTHPPNPAPDHSLGAPSLRCAYFPPPLLLRSAFRAQWSKSPLAERHESPKDHRIISDKPTGLEYRGMSSYCFGTSSSITRSRPSGPALQVKVSWSFCRSNMCIATPAMTSPLAPRLNRYPVSKLSTFHNFMLMS